MRKSSIIQGMEERHGLPLADIVTRALNEHGTIEAAARSVGVNPNTFYWWMIRLGIRVEKRAIAS